jgi:hypothetical protein
MAEPRQPEPAATEALAPDSLDAALAAAFAPDSRAPRSGGASVLRALESRLSAVPHVLLSEPPTEAVTPVHLPGSPEMPAVPAPGGRLELHGEIARGGMGAVLKGHDPDLGRDVAGRSP